MSGRGLPPIESVSGGSHGVHAGYEQMLALAERYERQAGDFVEMAGLGAKIMANGDLLESAILSPVSFGDAEVQVLDATTGVNGLTVRALGIEADALAVRAVVAAFQASDSLSKHAVEMLDNALGQLLLPAALASLPALVLAGGAGYAYFSTLSPQEQAALEARIAEDLGQFLHDHPEMAQHLINGGGGLLGSLVPGLGLLDPGDGPIDRATTNDAARLLALLLGNSTDYDVTHLDGIDPTFNQSHAPHSLEDLMLSLNDANLVDQKDPDAHGAIQIQKIMENGHERYIVYIPGTDDMSPIPQDGEHARDMETNYQLIGGLDTAYGRGIQQAMLAAGLEGKDVMLVGHSQGGMVSTSLAADPDFTRHFNVQHVVTAGSPTAQVPDLPSSTSAIHFENRGDAVPLLDGEDNPDQPNRTTVKFDEGSSDVGDNHAIRHYANGAAAADASTNGSIQDQVRQMQQDGYLGHGTVEGVSTYQITRG
ncbi:hypothetical protein ASG76_03950 [Nocardioides sp. Soil774]|uniref:PGAP1-like alpha/beta domain-containing protein n=1 Tax=Nocardioides sp. Soil774 TaxID=1736408 RepID=UPI0006F90A76|nr:hypothetical protein [Nocardioides sp. Soil774]KRE96198.1 hypothetical protein ASG76_03950 [Nocardioides sp. Soil774]